VLLDFQICVEKASRFSIPSNYYVAKQQKKETGTPRNSDADCRSCSFETPVWFEKASRFLLPLKFVSELQEFLTMFNSNLSWKPHRCLKRTRSTVCVRVRTGLFLMSDVSQRNRRVSSTRLTSRFRLAQSFTVFSQIRNSWFWVWNVTQEFKGTWSTVLRWDCRTFKLFSIQIWVDKASRFSVPSYKVIKMQKSPNFFQLRFKLKIIRKSCISDAECWACSFW